MNARTLVIASALWALAVPGCGRGGDDNPRGPGDCAAVGAKLVALGQAGLDELDSEHQGVMRAQLHVVEDRFVKACRKDHWPAEARACFLAAEDTASFDACAESLGNLETSNAAVTE